MATEIMEVAKNTNKLNMKCLIVYLFLSVIFPSTMVWAQFIDRFEGNTLDVGWETFTGDGYALSDISKKDKHGVFKVDATEDSLNIWWAILKRQIDGLDIQKLVLPEYELRVEAKIKVSHAPRRLNLHFNHSRTTDFHSHLKEYYIDDTSNWHVISMTTKNFDAILGDKVNVQLAIMDWGIETYTVMVDYIMVDVVKPSETGPDIGNPLEYHPEIPPLESFGNRVEMEGAVLDSSFPGLNFNNWNDGLNPVSGNLLSVGQSRFLIFKGDFSNHSSKKAKGLGVLSIHLHHFERSVDYKKDFGHLRLVEIIGGDVAWEKEQVTYHSFLKSNNLNEVINGQMIIDVDPTLNENGMLEFSIPEPVIQRLINGTTKGLAILPLGAVHASFYNSGFRISEKRPTAYFDVNKK